LLVKRGLKPFQDKAKEQPVLIIRDDDTGYKYQYEMEKMPDFEDFHILYFTDSTNQHFARPSGQRRNIMEAKIRRITIWIK
jgi:hypothetical protein